MKLEIKRFNELSVGELYEILRVRAEVFVVEQESSYNDIDEKDLESAHVTIREGEKLLAYLRVIKPGISYATPSMGRVSVIQEARGRGLAKRIVREGMNYIIDNWGDKWITISAQEYLKEFYKEFGFKSVSEVHLKNNIPHVDMRYEVQ